MGAHYRSARKYEHKYYDFSEMSTVASQSESAAKNAKGPANMKKAPPKFKSSYASIITEAIRGMKQKKGSSRQAIIKQIAGTSNTTPNALLITKTIKKMIKEGKLIPAAQAGHSGAGSFKISPQEKLRIKQGEKAAAKKASKQVAQKGKGMKLMKKVIKKASTKAKKNV